MPPMRLNPRDLDSDPRTLGMPGDIVMQEEEVERPNLNFRMACKQIKGRSTWVVDCPLCSRNEHGWNYDFTTKKEREFRTKAAAERYLTQHAAGDHHTPVPGQVEW